MNGVSIMDLMEYRELYNSGVKTSTVGFFGGSNSTEIGPKMLSNFYPSEFKLGVGGNVLTFDCNEQFFMWGKAIQFKAHQTAYNILQLKYNPREARQLGRREIFEYNDNEWIEVREKWMKTGLRLKFSQSKVLGDYLLSTGDAVLIEVNPRDNVWACGLSIHDDYHDPNLWTGENRLGFLLMEVRDELRRKINND